MEAIIQSGELGNILYFPWEISLMEWLQGVIGEGWLLSLISTLSMFGEQLLMVVVMGFLYWGWNKEFGKYVGVNVLVASVWNPMLKNLVLRLRPYFVSDRIKLLRLIDKDADAMDVAAQGFSFPSGHSSGAVSLYGSLSAHEKKNRLLRVLAIVLPLLVGFSRVVVGAHFPTDVLFGWLLGLLVVLLLPWLRRKIKNRWVFNLLLLLTALPGFLYCASTDYYTSFGMLLGFVLAEPFEEKFVRFENTHNLLRCLLRVIGGAVLYFGLNTLLKLPFPEALLDAPTLAAYLIRSGRYAVVIFVVIGVYPMLFRLGDRIWKKKG